MILCVCLLAAAAEIVMAEWRVRLEIKNKDTLEREGEGEWKKEGKNSVNWLSKHDDEQLILFPS